MALYYFRIKAFSRSKGCRVTRAAAYRAGERMRDARTSESYDYSTRDDIVHKEIVLPSQMGSVEEMSWARDRATLWNAAEHAGRVRNACLAKEILVTLPPELDGAQRTRLALKFARELADRFQNAVDVSVHQPRPGSDERNHHAHLLMTTRRVTSGGLGARIDLQWSGTERRAQGLPSTRVEVVRLRERWAQSTNEALQEAGIAARVDHRSYQDQGIAREARPRLPQSAYYHDRSGHEPNQAAASLRARYRERVEARLQGDEALQRVLRRQKSQAREFLIQKAKEKASRPPKLAYGAFSRDEINQLRRDRHVAIKDEFNRRQRERRNANREETNRKQREYWKACAPQRAARKAAARPDLGLQPSAEQSVQNWLAYKERGNPQPGEDSVRRWLAYREQQAQVDEPPHSGAGRALDPRVPEAVEGVEDSHGAQRHHGYDVSR